LQQTLTTAFELASVFNSVLGIIKLDKTLKLAKRLCNKFAVTITSFTNHLIKGKFSKQDRLTIYFRKLKINKFNKELGNC
jgi:hypothetical protein